MRNGKSESSKYDSSYAYVARENPFTKDSWAEFTKMDEKKKKRGASMDRLSNSHLVVTTKSLTTFLHCTIQLIQLGKLRETSSRP